MDDTHGLHAERLVWMFTQMLRIREFEERVKRSFTELPGLLRGTRIWPTAPRRPSWGR
jgi:acetoin:2,6-dichlorophenolindophenol oxidoreductase subunit alpha